MKKYHVCGDKKRRRRNLRHAYSKERRSKIRRAETDVKLNAAASHTCHPGLFFITVTAAPYFTHRHHCRKTKLPAAVKAVSAINMISANVIVTTSSYIAEFYYL